jgi:DNA-binding LacI/PurR family transcriptional regulator
MVSVNSPVSEKRNHQRTGRPTLERVAARAGVSRTTVSRVVNGWPSVAPHLRESVEKAVADLGYVPNLAARSLVTQRTDAMALVLSQPPDRMLADEPFLSGVIRGVSDELEGTGKHLVLLLASTPGGDDSVDRYVAAGHVDGVVAVSTQGPSGLPEALARHGVPVVCSGRSLTRGRLPYVDVDNVGGATAAVTHLLDRGRRRIATIAGPQDTVAGVDRMAGYREALRGTERRSIVAVGEFTRESGVGAMRQLLDDDPMLDAVFVANDMMAIGALDALRDAGRKVPGDVAVVGFDDIDAARYTRPALTTVRQPMVEFGRQLVRLLCRLDAGDAAESVVMPTELVVRAST